jgi:hypothetical protein
VLRAFETARAQAASRTAGAGGSSHSSSKAWLIGGGAAVAAGTAIALATHGGDSTSAAPTLSGARFDVPVIVCPNGSDNLHLPFRILIESSNKSGQAIPITSVTSVLTIVNSSIPSEINFGSSQATTVVPSTLPAGQAVTLQVDSFLVCGNGNGDAPRVNEWSGRVTLATAAGVFMVDVADHLHVNIP